MIFVSSVSAKPNILNIGCSLKNASHLFSGISSLVPSGLKISKSITSLVAGSNSTEMLLEFSAELFI